MSKAEARKKPAQEPEEQRTEIVEYSATEAALSDLRERFKGVIFDVTTREGMGAAVKGRAELRTYRVNLEKTRVAIKEPALKRCQLIDSEARRITRELEALEDPIDAQIKAEEKRKEDEKLAAQRAEEARIAAEERARKEEEERKLAAQREELARQEAELKRKREEAEAEERARRERIEAEERESRRRIEEAERLARAEREREDAQRRAREEEERKARYQEEDRLRREREAADQARRAAEEEARKLREAEEERQRQARAEEERKEREARLAKAERTDARELLKTFMELYGKKPEFAAVVKAITGYFRDNKE